MQNEKEIWEKIVKEYDMNFEPKEIIVRKDETVFEFVPRHDGFVVREPTAEAISLENEKFISHLKYKVYSKFFIIAKGSTFSANEDLQKLLSEIRKIRVMGNTFPVKDFLKQNEFRFRNLEKCWERE